MRKILAGLVLFIGGYTTATVYWLKFFIKVKYAPWSSFDTMMVSLVGVATWAIAGAILYIGAKKA